MTKATTPTEPYYLYVLMRTDLASMNPGKAVAHGAHAGNQFDYAMRQVSNKELLAGYDAWVKSADFFGTTITLGVNEAQLKSHVSAVAAVGSSVVAGEVFDPTYPIRDGEVCHFIPLTTCGFVFGPVSVLKPLLADLDLMR
jgi:hypothetical protein